MDFVERPDVSLHMAVLKNDRGALAKWFAHGTQHWESAEAPRRRGSKTWMWDDPGDSPLHSAARSGDLARVRELLNGRTSAYVRNSRQEIPLLIAVRAGHYEVACHLMGNRISRRSAVLVLTNAVSTDIIRQVLRVYRGSRHELINYALCVAVEDNLPQTVDMLLKSGANPNAINSFGTPVLSLSAVTGYEATTQILMRGGASVRMRSRQDGSVVHAVARAGKASMLAFFIKMGVDINLVDSHNRTPLFYAVENKNNETIDFLLKQNANINHPDERLWTPLHFAANLGKCAEAKKLLYRGATPNALNASGMKPWEIARSKRLRKLLRKACNSKPDKFK